MDGDISIIDELKNITLENGNIQERVNKFIAKARISAQRGAGFVELYAPSKEIEYVVVSELEKLGFKRVSDRNKGQEGTFMTWF